MKHIFNKKDYLSLLENINVTSGNLVFIHHPITEDLVQVIVKELKRDKVIVSIPENSPYFGQPDFIINKTAILGSK